MPCRPFPLQVQTNKGADYLLQLRDIRSEKSILAAYIRGGEFFRVLVPPGRYDLLFVAGTEWKGEVEQFSRTTQRFVLDPPLTFRATISRKNGHLVDLRETADITVRDWAICQRLEFDSELSLQRSHRRANIPYLPFEAHRYLQFHDYHYYSWRYEVRSRFCD